MGSGTSALPLSAPLAGLTPGVTYHFRVAATNGYGVVYGADQSFTTVVNAAFTALDIQAFIDGRDRLLIRSNTLQWLHYDWAAVGRWNGSNEPTIISTAVASKIIMSNVAWLPTWPKPPPAEIRYPTNSSAFTDLTPPLPPNETQAITLTPITARGAVSIVEYPSASNGFAVLVQFDDDAVGRGCMVSHQSVSPASSRTSHHVAATEFHERGRLICHLYCARAGRGTIELQMAQRQCRVD